MELLDLPNELLLAIIVLIGGFDILPCRLICKRVQELIDHSAESQLSIELASECLALAPWNDVPAATLLDQLRRSREAWRTLRPTHEEIIPIQDEIVTTYQVCGHVLAQANPSATPKLEFWEMPVGGLMAVEGEENRRWHHKYVDMGMDVVNFTLDPSQDALLLVEKKGSSYIFHLRTLSNNMHHPDAKMIKMATKGPLQPAWFDLRIRDRYIVALIVSPLVGKENVFTMWDWKSGECVLHELGVCSYTFLDACTPLLVVAKDDRRAFTTRSPSRPCGANSNSKSEKKAKYLAFPDVSKGVEYRDTTVFHDSKLPQPESYPPTSMSFSRPTVPAQADHGIVVLSLCVSGHDAFGMYLVFFLREALARLFQQEQECSLEGGGEGEGEGEVPYVMDWADWGPEASRWFVAPRYCSVDGYRYGALVTRLEASILISPSFTQAGIDIIIGTKGPPPDADAVTDAVTDADEDEDEGADTDADAPLHLLVFDFNPYALRRHQCSPPPPPTDNSPSDTGNGNTVVITPSDVTLHDWEGRFKEEVTGRLACRATLMDKPADYTALAACEDNIVGFYPLTKNKRGGLRVLTF